MGQAAQEARRNEPLTLAEFDAIDAIMRTTIDISDALLAELRQRAAASGQPFRKVVEEALQVGLAGQLRVSKPVRLKTYPVGVKAAYRGLSMNQLYDQLETDSHLKVADP